MFVKAPTENSILKGEINLPFLNQKKFDRMEDNLLMAIRQVRASIADEQQSRKLKIRSGWRSTLSGIYTNSTRQFPEILLKGVWLEKYGFVKERYIYVFPFNNVLVICQE